jgi:hypothetical protein
MEILRRLDIRISRKEMKISGWRGRSEGLWWNRTTKEKADHCQPKH